MRSGIWFLVVVMMTVCLLSATPAFAQKKFADDGRVVLGAERLTGLFFERIKLTETTRIDDVDGTTDTVEVETQANTTTFALLGTTLGPQGGSTTAGGMSMAPRLAADVFVAGGFSVGGALTYVHSEGTTEVGTPGELTGDDEDQEDHPTINGIVFAPRVGFAVPLSRTFALWPRAGVTHSVYWASFEEDDVDDPVKVTQTLSFTDLTLEGMMAVTPLPNVAIVFGPYLDLGLGGSAVTEFEPDQTPGVETDIDLNYTSFGITGGIALVF